MTPLVDRFGRIHNNLRVGVTDRCNIRCKYCMPERVEFLPKDHLLTFEEIVRFIGIASTAGVDKIRLTGGEPLLRNGLPDLVRMIRRNRRIVNVGLTTNGVLLAEQAEELHSAGVDRLNISLDTLNARQFLEITRRDCFAATIAGIDAAATVGFACIKINAVVMRGVNDDQVVPLAKFCRARGFEMRFIEFMPLEADRIWNRDAVLTGDEILTMLADGNIPVLPIPRTNPHAPAEDFAYVDGGGKLGIVASVSKPFCGSCNRIRITADGKFRNCLFAIEETDIKGALRNGASDAAILDCVRHSVDEKWEGHQIGRLHFIRPERTMHSIGG